MPVQLTLENLGVETPVTATLLWPLGSQLLDSIPAATVENELTTWTFDLAANQQSVLTSWAIPDYVDSSTLVVAELFIGDDTTQDPYQHLELTLQALAAEDLSAVKQALLNLIDVETDLTDKGELQQALDSLEEAERLYNEGNAESALPLLLNAATHLSTVDNSDVIELRLRVDAILWQWGQQVDAGRVRP